MKSINSTPVFSIRFLASSLGLALLSAGLPALALADDVTEQVEEAMQAYKDKDYPMAAQGLETAAQMIRQMRGEGLVKYLPEPIKGWKAGEGSSEAAGAAMFGGGVTVSRDYEKEDAGVTIQYITDSPMLQSVMMMFNMPMMAGSAGVKIERIKGQKAMVNADDLSVSIVVGGSMLVQIQGSGCELDDLRAFAAAIDYNALSNAL